nr:hypothetical protein [Tanacetum cinerariifolium]
MSIRPVWRKKLNFNNTSNEIDVNLPTPMPKPQSSLKESSQENPPTTLSNHGFKPHKEYQPIPKKSIVSSSGNKEKSVEPTIDVSNSNPFDALNSVDNDVKFSANGRTTNMENNETTSSGSSFMNVGNSSSGTTPIIEKITKFEDLLTSWQAILVDKAGNPLKKVEFLGFGTQSLLEKWRDSYGNGDYDDDMYEVQDLSHELQAVCDNMDIRVRGHKKK